MPNTSLNRGAHRLLAAVRTAFTRLLARPRPGLIAEPLDRELNRKARFWPADPDDEDTLPVVDYGGLLVFVYRDAESKEVQVSVDLDTVDPRLLLRGVPGGLVPLHITVQGETVYRSNADPVSAALHQLLRILDPNPGDSEGPQPKDAAHDHLVTALTTQKTPHRQAGDSAGQYVVIDLPCGLHTMHVHNPLNETYGFDWDITDDDAQQLLTGTWRLGSADTAHRIRSLLNALPR